MQSQEETEGWTRADKNLPLSCHPTLFHLHPLPPPCVSFLPGSKQGSMLFARVSLQNPLLLPHGGRLPPLLCPEPPKTASRACLPLHESTCYGLPREGMAYTLGVDGRELGTPGPSALSPDGAGWPGRAGSQVSRAQRVTLGHAGFGGLFKALETFPLVVGPSGQGRSPTPLPNPRGLRGN